MLACWVGVEISDRVKVEHSEGDMMRMNFPVTVICMVAFFFAGGVGMASQTNSPNSGSWSGVIMNNNCTAGRSLCRGSQVHRERCARRKTSFI